MELNIAERLTILSLDSLPKQGNLATMRVMTKLMEKVGFSEEELVKWGIVQEGDKVTWKSTDPGNVDLNITTKEKELIQGALKTATNVTPLGAALADKFEVADE